MVLHTPQESRTPRVVACSSQASRYGVQVGMPLAEARTLAYRGWFELYNADADREELKRLAWRCQPFTPRAGLEEADAPQCLFLDMTGCAHHFGGLDSACLQVAEFFHSLGYDLCIVAAPTFGAAWARAHASDETAKKRTNKLSANISLIPPEDLKTALSPLPIWTLRLPEKILATLAECGFQTIGQLLVLPRSSLPSRFGDLLLKRLDQALGDAEELLAPEMPPQPIRGEMRFEFPLSGAAQVTPALRELLSNIVDDLKQSCQETQRLIVTWKTEESCSGSCEVRLLRATSSPQKLWELLSLRLEDWRLPGAIASLTMEAIPCPSRSIQSASLFDDDASREAEFCHLLERLGSRLGESAIVHYRLLPEHQPEFVATAQEWFESAPKKLTAKRTQELAQKAAEKIYPPIRPLRLLASPVPLLMKVNETTGLPSRFHFEHHEHLVAHCEGPERIETGWWRGATVRRDYYRTETTSGARFWLFQELTRAKWFLQGIFE